jgi:hypothetical protein
MTATSRMFLFRLGSTPKSKPTTLAFARHGACFNVQGTSACEVRINWLCNCGQELSESALFTVALGPCSSPLPWVLGELRSVYVAY